MVRKETNMADIEKVLVVGRGAVGGLFGSLIAEKIGENFAFLCDGKRKKRYTKVPYFINGEKKEYQYISKGDSFFADLILITTKAGAFREAMEQIKPFLKEDTILISGLNGIESDELLMKNFRQPVIRAIAQKMDARYQNDALNYSKTGELVIGIEREDQKESFDRLVSFFDEIEFPYLRSEDIVHDQYSKLMLNCGINQVCAVYQATYGQVVKDPKLRELFIDTMKETRDVLKSCDVIITDRQIDEWVNAIEALDPDSMPSMAQDVLAKRKTEVGLFSGTILQIANLTQKEAPINAFLKEKIEKITLEYSNNPVPDGE